MSRTPEIMEHYLRLPTTYEIWSVLAKAFYDGSDELQAFSLNKRAFSAKQSGKPFFLYYGEFTEIFQELDHHYKVVMKDADDIVAYKKSIERHRVHIFLVGLDKVFDQMCEEIPRKKKKQIPNL